MKSTNSERLERIRRGIRAFYRNENYKTYLDSQDVDEVMPLIHDLMIIALNHVSIFKSKQLFFDKNRVEFITKASPVRPSEVLEAFAKQLARIGKIHCTEDQFKGLAKLVAAELTDEVNAYSFDFIPKDHRSRRDRVEFVSYIVDDMFNALLERVFSLESGWGRPSNFTYPACYALYPKLQYYIG